MNIRNIKVNAICEGAVVIAISMVLGYIKIFELPQGGSITIGMMPIFIYCHKWGAKYGFIVSFTYGLLQLVLDGAFAASILSVFLDYIFAYGVLGVAGFFTKDRLSLYIGSWISTFCRFIVHFISGITIYKIYAPEILFNYSFTNPILYSAVYNGSYLFISCLLCILIMICLNRLIILYKKKK